MGSKLRLCLAAAIAALFGQPMPAAMAQTPPAAVQRPPTMAVDFDYFLQRLSSYGRWLRHPVWGDVWQPDAGVNFRPYFYGYWQYTSDYGWLWVSNEPYGDIVYHYGRWAYDPNFGWIWVPGYVWGPSWVAWRDGGDYIGWLPMPPGYQDFSPGSVAPAYSPADLYGYQFFYGNNFPVDAFEGLWLFVPNQDFGRRDRRPYVFDKDKVRDLYRRSHDRTHYEHDRDHDRVVDRSIDKDELEHSTHRTFGDQAGRQFLRRDTPITSVTEGQEIARRDRVRGHERFRSPPNSPANPPAQNPPPQIGAGQTGEGAVAAGPRRVGRGLFAVPPSGPNPPSVGAQMGSPAAPVISDAPSAAQTGASATARARTPRFSGRVPAAPGQPPMTTPANTPSTDGLAGAQNPAVTRFIPPQSPAADSVSVAPSGVRVRRFGGTQPAAVVPGVAPGLATVAPAPVIPPAVGFQRGPSLPAVPAVPQIPSAAAAAPQQGQALAPHTMPSAPQSVIPFPRVRGSMSGFQAPP